MAASRFSKAIVVGALPGAFDFVVFNPPYVTTAEMAELPRDIRDHAPHLALEGGSQGDLSGHARVVHARRV